MTIAPQPLRASHIRTMASETNIWISASDGDIEAVKGFIASGVDVNAQDESGYSAL